MTMQAVKVLTLLWAANIDLTYFMVMKCKKKREEEFIDLPGRNHHN